MIMARTRQSKAMSACATLLRFSQALMFAENPSYYSGPWYYVLGYHVIQQVLKFGVGTRHDTPPLPPPNPKP